MTTVSNSRITDIIPLELQRKTNNYGIKYMYSHSWNQSLCAIWLITFSFLLCSSLSRSILDLTILGANFG